MLELQLQSQSPLASRVDATQIIWAVVCMFAALGIVLLIHKAIHVEGSNLIGRLEVVAFGIIVAPFMIATVVKLSQRISDPRDAATELVTLTEFFTIFAALAGSLAIYLGARYLEKKLLDRLGKYR